MFQTYWSLYSISKVKDDQLLPPPSMLWTPRLSEEIKLSLPRNLLGARMQLTWNRLAETSKWHNMNSNLLTPWRYKRCVVSCRVITFPSFLLINLWVSVSSFAICIPLNESEHFCWVMKSRCRVFLKFLINLCQFVLVGICSDSRICSYKILNTYSNSKGISIFTLKIEESGRYINVKAGNRRKERKNTG